MADFTITVDDKAVRAKLDHLAAIGVPGEKVMRQVALAAKQETYNTFRFSRAPGGAPWPALKSATLKARQRKGSFSTQPLIATGKMYAGIESDATDSTATVTVGGGLPDARAWYNQFGTLKSPQRAFLPISTMGTPDPTADWLRRVRKPIDDAVKAATA